MASVYKSISKKKQQRPADDEEDIDMNDFIDEDDSDDSEDDDDHDDEEVDGNTAAQLKNIKDGFMPKTRVLMLTSRGVTHRYAFSSLRCMANFRATTFFFLFFFFRNKFLWVNC